MILLRLAFPNGFDGDKKKGIEKIFLEAKKYVRVAKYIPLETWGYLEEIERIALAQAIREYEAEKKAGNCSSIEELHRVAVEYADLDGGKQADEIALRYAVQNLSEQLSCQT